jgi:hypothetical protein
VPDSDTFLWLPYDAFPKAFAPNASADEHIVLAAIQRPLRFSCMTTPTAGPVLWNKVPSWKLLPYAVSLPAAGRANAPGALDAARRVTLRYSNLATAAVLTILATGVVNTLNLVGSLSSFTSSEYGRLLSLKLVVFVVMLAFAAINRFVLVPRFSAMDVGALKRNALIEPALGAVALLLVATFGTMAPPLLDAGVATD